MQRSRDRVVTGKCAVPQATKAIVLRSVLQERGDAEIDAQRRILGFIGQF